MMARAKRKYIRLQAQEWRQAALRKIAESGVESVKVENLAASLGASKGGFYGYYKDRDALLMNALQSWAQLTRDTANMIDAKGGTPRDRLVYLLKLCCECRNDVPGGRLEMAFREWAISDERVRQILDRVQKERLAYVKNLYREMGLDNTSAETHAFGFLAYVTGQQILTGASTSKSRKRFEQGVALLIDIVDLEVV